jgi:hypothetical protein
MQNQYESLKQRHREVRDDYPSDLNLRIHRALSWFQRAAMAEDMDGRFIFLWIAFNAAYATEIEEGCRLSEQATFRAFLEKLCALDEARQIDALVWNEFSGCIRVLLDTPYVFQSFWDWQSGKIAREEWEERLERGKRRAHHALGSGNTALLLGEVFNRLYTMRNQLVHGGATWNSSVNRRQMRDCTNLLGKLVPILIHIMLENPETVWGTACYPVVQPD